MIRVIPFVCLCAAFWLPCRAQQAIVNMPSADIAAKGEHFLMHETQWRPWNPGSYWYGTNFYTYGVGHGTELAVTSYNAGSPGVVNQNIGVGFKSAIPLAAKTKSELEQKLTLGSMALINYKGEGLGNFTYSHYSFRLPKHQTRLTMGGWFGTEQLFKKNTANVLAGIEHPLSKRVILLGEWFAGNHDLGFFIPGILFHPTPRQIIVIAYKIANNSRNGAGGLVLEYGFYIGGKEKNRGH
jgi:hypothetical protein